MNDCTIDTPRPIRCDGLLEVVRFNWPQYVLGIAAIAFAAAALWLYQWDSRLQWAITGVTSLVAWWLVASLFVTHWVYDRSRLRQWNWLNDCLTKPPRRWVNIHTGFDETTRALQRVFTGSPGSVIDLYDRDRMTEPSIHRAHREQTRHITDQDIQPTPASADALPIANQAADAAFLLLAAHELRTRTDRAALFSELYRCLSNDGRAVLVEHARDPWNFAAYGPGCLHFYPARLWRQLASQTGFSLISERRVTPFVRCFVFGKEPT